MEVFQEIEKLDCTGAMFILDNSRNADKVKINDIFYTHLAALLANENGSDVKIGKEQGKAACGIIN